MIFDKLKTKLKPNPDLTKNIIDAGLTFRTYHILRRQGMAIVGDLVQLSRNDIKAMRRSTRKTVEEVERVLGEMRLGLREE